MKKINYHTHTYRCGHAAGSEKDYVQSAINMGMEEIGFSDHIPLPHYRLHIFKSVFSLRSLLDIARFIRTIIKNGPDMRMQYKQIEEHLTEVKKLKSKYNQIKIFQGFEAEYLEEYLPYYKRLLDDKTADYLILGNHFNKYCIHRCYFGKDKLTKEELYCYVENIEKAIETEMFSYIAHPDLFMIGYKHFDKYALEVTERICKKAKEYDIPLEINGGGMKRGLVEKDGEMFYPYPDARFWKIASKVGNKVIIGLDAHNPSDYNDVLYEQLVNFAKELQLNLVENLELKRGK